MLADATREKEKLIKVVRGTQRKIIGNLRERKENLRSDSNKLYGEFRGTIEMDRQATSYMRKSMVITQGSAAKSRAGRTNYTYDEHEIMFWGMSRLIAETENDSHVHSYDFC